MALVEARGTAAACFSISSHHPRHAMGYHQHPYGGASGSGRPTTNSPAAQLDDVVFDYLLPDDESVVRHPPAPGAPGTLFGTTTPPPPRRLPVEQLVVAPDAAGYYGHAAASSSRSAAAESPTMMRTERIAFRMRSDEEVLDDGYKWRKYGKKSVKNSPNPRNYYRCSTEGCNVKKRVERDRDDPRYVVTMYDGVHNHVAPGTVYYAAQDAASGRFFVAGMHHPGP